MKHDSSTQTYGISCLGSKWRILDTMGHSWLEVPETSCFTSYDLNIRIIRSWVYVGQSRIAIHVCLYLATQRNPGRLSAMSQVLPCRKTLLAWYSKSQFSWQKRPAKMNKLRPLTKWQWISIAFFGVSATLWPSGCAHTHKGGECTTFGRRCLDPDALGVA